MADNYILRPKQQTTVDWSKPQWDANPNKYNPTSWEKKPDKSIPTSIRRPTFSETMQRQVSASEAGQYWRERDERIAREKKENEEEAKRLEEKVEQGQKDAYQRFLDRHPVLKALDYSDTGATNLIGGTPARIASKFPKMIFGITQMLGGAVNNQAVTHASSVAGDINLNKEALAFKDDAKAYNTLQLQRAELYDELTTAEKGSDEYYALANAIKQIDLQLNDKEFLDKVTAFKSRMWEINLDNDNIYAKTATKVLGGAKDIAFDVAGLGDEAPTNDMFKNDPDLQAKANYEKRRTQALMYNKKVDRILGLPEGLPAEQAEKMSPGEIRKWLDNKQRQRWSKENEIIDNLSKRTDEKNKGLSEDYVEAMQFQQKTANLFNRNKSYELGEQVYQDRPLYDLNWWYYCYPGVFGSSNSSKNQAAATAMQVGGALGSAVAAKVGVPIKVAGRIATATALGSFPFNVAGGEDENKAEVQTRWENNMLRNLQDKNLVGESGFSDILDDLSKKSVAYWKSKGMPDEWIAENRNVNSEAGVKAILSDAMTGIIQSNDPRYRKAEIESQAGLQALFQADNARTMASAYAETMFMVAPTGGLLRQAKKYTGKAIEKAVGTVSKNAAAKFRNKFATNVVEDASGKIVNKPAINAARDVSGDGAETAASTYKNGFKKADRTVKEAFKSGYGVGAEAGEAAGFGYAGRVIGGTATGAVNASANYLKKHLGRKASAAVDAYTEAFINKYQNVYNKLLPLNSFRYFAAKYGLRYGKAWFLSSLTEMAEEGVQNLNSREDYAAKYGYNGMSFGDLVANDLRQGGRVFNAWLSLIGLGDSELKDDADFWNDAKGGFAAGGGPTAVVRAVRDIGGAIEDYNTNTTLINSAIFNREANAISRADNRKIVDLVSRGKASSIYNVLNDRMEADSRSENPNFTEEMYLDKIQEVRMIENEVNNQNTVDALQAKGIEKGTLQFNTAIADIVKLKQQYKENRDQQQEVIGNLSQLYSDKSLHEDIARIVETDISDRQKLASGREAKRQAILSKNVEDRTDEGLKFLEDGTVAEEEENANQGHKRYRVLQRTKLANKLNALLQLKAKVNTVDGFYNMLRDKFHTKTLRPDAKLIGQNIDAQIKSAKNALQKLLQEDGQYGTAELDDLGWLNLTQTMSGVTTANRDEIIEAETANALLGADRAVTQKYLDQFSYGVVGKSEAVLNDQKKNAKRSWYGAREHINPLEYNPAEYEKERKQADEQMRAMLRGEEYTPESTPRMAKADHSKDAYVQRIQAIIDADERNAKLNWMINDIYSGDFASKIEDSLAGDFQQEKLQLTDSQQAEAQKLVDQFAGQLTTEEGVATAYENARNKIRNKYSTRRKRVRDWRKNTLGDYRRNRANRLSLTLPFEGAVVDYIISLVDKALEGAYTIGEFFEEAKLIYDMLGEKMSSSDVRELKQAYRLGAASVLQLNPDVSGNLSTSGEIRDFHAAIVPEVDVRQTTPAQKLQEVIDADNARIIEDVSDWYSTFVKDGDKVTIYRRYDADQFEVSDIHTNTYYIDVTQTLNRAQNEREFGELLDKLQEKYKDNKYRDFDFSAYKSYYGVAGITDAVARAFTGSARSASIQNGNVVRNAILNYFTTGDEQWLRDIQFVNLTDGQFTEASFSKEQRDELVNNIRKLYNDLQGSSFKIVNTHSTIYGVVDGKPVSVQADLVLVSDRGNIAIYDIASSYTKLTKESIKNPVTQRATFTHEQKFASALSGVIDVLQQKTQYRVVSAAVLPIQIDTKQQVLSVHDTIRVRVSDINTQTENDPDLGELQSKLSKLTEEYNALVDEYNYILEMYPSISSDNSRDGIEDVVFSDAGLCSEAIKARSSEIEQLRSDIDKLNQQIQEHRVDVYSQSNRDRLQEEYRAQTNKEDTSEPLEVLFNTCTELDSVLGQVVFIKPTTEYEQALFNSLRDKLYDAELALSDVLSDEDAQFIDVTKEAQLILDAAQKVTSIQSTESQVMLNTFVSNLISTNDTHILNKLLVWNKALAPVVELVTDDPVARSWYGIFLNNYYKNLLSRAQEKLSTIEDPAQAVSLKNSILEGFDRISQFNRMYPDAASKAGLLQDPVASINAMTIGYVSNGEIIVDVRAQSSSRNWIQISDAPNLLHNATFELFLDESDLDEFDQPQVKLKCTTQQQNHGTQSTSQIVFDFKHLGNTQESQEARDKVANFITKARRALQFAEQNPGYKVVLNVSRGVGGFIHDIDKDTGQVTRHRVGEHLMKYRKENQFNVANATVSEKNRIGIITCQQTGDGQLRYFIRTGNGLQTPYGNYLDYCDGRPEKDLSGTLVYMYDTGMRDGKNQYRAAILTTSPYTKDQIGYLTRTLKNCADGVNNDVSGLNQKDVLSLWLYVGDENQYVSENSSVANRVMITPGSGIVKIGQDEYETSDPYFDMQVTGRLGNINPRARLSLLNENLNNTTVPILASIRDIVLNSKVGPNEPVVVAGMTFKKEHFTGNYTFLGYLMTNDPNGKDGPSIGTTVKKNTAVPLKINDIRLIGPQTASFTQEVEQPKAPQPKTQQEQNKQALRELFDAELDMSEEDPVFRTFTQQSEFMDACREYVRKVLGEDAAKNIRFGKAGEIFLRNAGKNARVLGMCTTACLKMSLYAPESVMFHEAFHQIIELTMNEDDRESLYAAYRSHIANGNSLTEREVAEGLCDMFTDYMTNKTKLKTAEGFGKIKAFFKNVAFHIGMFARYRSKYAKFIGLYNDINRGKYADRKITEEQNRRFKQRFGTGLAYEVTNYDTNEKASFSHIKDSGELHHMAEGLAFLILSAMGVSKAFPRMRKINIDGRTPYVISQQMQDTLCGKGIPEDQLTDKQRAFREVFEHEERIKHIEEKKDKDGKIIRKAQDKLYTYYPNFAAMSKLVFDKAKHIMSTKDTDTKMRTAEQDAERSTDDKAVEKNIDKFDRAAYEFDKLDAFDVRVKMFFSTIPYLIPADNKKGYALDTSRNPFGVPTFMPMTMVYQTMVDEMHDCQTPEELLEMMRLNATKDPLHARIYAKYDKLFKAKYKTDKDGKQLVDKNGDPIIDYDVQNLIVNVFRAIKSQKLNYMIARSTRDKDGNKTVDIVNSAYDKDAVLFPKQWYSFLIGGQTGVFEPQKTQSGHYILTKDYRNAKKNVFKFTVDFFNDLRVGLMSINPEITAGNEKYNLDASDDLLKLKERIVSALNLVGIQVTTDSINYMLSQQYGNIGKSGLTQWLNARGVTSIDNFLTALSSAVDTNGVATEGFAKFGYSKTGFVKNLGDWQGRYNRTFVTSMTEGLDLTKNYTISQNHAVSAILSILNRRDSKNPTFNAIMDFAYNLNRGLVNEGSIVLKAIAANKEFTLRFNTYGGFRTDNNGDYGVKYQNEPEIEDAVAKIAMLQDGYLVPPTFADKGTWGFIGIINPAGNNQANAVKIPGLTYVKQSDGSLAVADAPRVGWVGREAYLIPNDAVLDQMIEYANCELAGIEKCIDDLKTLPEDRKTINYYTNNGNVEPNGTRFLTLSQLTVPVYDSRGKLVDTRTVNLNDPRKKSAELVELAKKEFFGKSKEEQRNIMALTLWGNNKKAVKKFEDLGVVSRFSLKEEVNGKLEYLADRYANSLNNIENVHLDEQQIGALTEAIWKQLPWNKLSNGQAKTNRVKIARSLAIAALLGDVTNRSVISEQEAERLFIGHPGLFKIKYGEDKISNLCADKQKRVGSLMSTGDDNAIAAGLPSQYTCAECNDYKVTSNADAAKEVPKLFYNAELRHAYVSYAIANKGLDSERATKDAFDLSQQEIEAFLQSITLKDGKTLLERVKDNASRFSNSLLTGINVADGSAYITEDMCANLLKMNGAYTEDVDRAFKMLADEGSSWIDQKEATDIIYENVALVTTKYTAYGIRKHEITGAAIHYVNKFALFPLFKCNATGNMRGIYEKMHAQGVDMLMMTSAVKVGSQGAVTFSGTEITDDFATYSQPYALLRKQLKTDPEEGDTGAMGTQAVKKVLSNLLLGRDYINAHSENNLKTEEESTITGEELLRDIMHNIQRLSEFGEKEISDTFFSNDNVDAQKLSKWLKSQMSDRDADLIVQRALDIVNDQNGSKKMALPLAATPDSHWIESIMISHVNKRVIDIRTPGNSFVQRSVFATESKFSVKDGSIQGATQYNGQQLQMINEDGSMDAVVSLDYFRNILPKGLSPKEAREWLIENKIIGPDAKANTIGYRIPTQAQSSIHAIRFVDVTFGVQSTIILPQEFTKITGSDFDIDHLYLASYNYKTDKNGVVTTQFGEDSRQFYENGLLDNMMTLLKDVNNSFTSLFKSIDNDTELVENISDKIPDGEAVQHLPYIYGTLDEQISRRIDYVTGKIGIGPFALNCTNQVLTQLFHVAFRDDKFTQNTRIHRLDHIHDKDYNYIDAWMSAFINAHVDIVKDPYVSKLNINQTTYNHLNLLLRSGYGDTSVWFMCSPVIRKISEIDKMFSSKFAKDFDFKTTREEKMTQALKPLIGELTEDDMDLLTSSRRSEERAALVNKILEDRGADRLEQVGRDGESTDTQYNKEVYLVWKILEPYSKGLSELVQYTKIDTRKHGKNLIEIRRYLANYHNLIGRGMTEEQRKHRIFDMASIERLTKQSWIDYKTETAIELPFKILGEQTFYANNQFMNAVFDCASELTSDNVPSTQLVKDVANAMETATQAEFMNNWIEQQGIDVHKLFYGNWTIAKTLGYLQGCVSGKIQTKDRKDLSRLKNNQLLKQLRVETVSEEYLLPSGHKAPGIEFLTVSRNIDNSTVDGAAMMSAWADLLNDESEAVRAFAQRLVAYAFITSGAYSGWNKLFKYVPFEWRTGQVLDSRVGDESYGEFIERKLKYGQFDSGNVARQIISNNFLNTNMVQKDSLRDADGNIKYYSTNNQKDPNSPNVLGRAYVVDNTGVARVPKYVAIRREQKCANQQLQYDLYECISDTQLLPSDEYGMRMGAFYVKIPKSGYHIKKGYDIYEYGSSVGIAENQGADLQLSQVQHSIDKLRQFIGDTQQIDGKYSFMGITETKGFADVLEAIYTQGQSLSNDKANDFIDNAVKELREQAVDDLAAKLNVSREEAADIYDKGEENRKNCKGE